jgi:hypothetical protein
MRRGEACLALDQSVQREDLLQDSAQIQPAETHDHRRPAANGPSVGGHPASFTDEGCVTPSTNAIAARRVEAGGGQAVKQLQQRVGHGITSFNTGVTGRVSVSRARASITRARWRRCRSASGVMPQTSAASG